MTVRAPAKINLDLRILGLRRDGYHELHTLLQSIALHDTLRLRARAGPLTVRCRSRGVPSDRNNLVWAAARALWMELGRSGLPHGVGIEITKRIPMAGGLGGGSSDAASALRGLCALWGVAPGTRRLTRVAATLGADVPFFLCGGLVRGVGRGDELRRLPDLDRRWVLLAVPEFGVSTRAAYEWFRAASTCSSRALPRDWRTRLRCMTNDLEGPVVERHPPLAAMIRRLHATAPLHAAMSGSGSALFALYAAPERARAARRAIQGPGWRTMLTHTLTYAEASALARPET